MPEPEEEQERCPNQPAPDMRCEGRSDHYQDEDSGQMPMPRAGKRVKNMSAIQLPDWKQIQSCRENSDPSGAADRMQINIRGTNTGQNQPFQQSLYGWHAEDKVTSICNARYNSGFRDSQGERRKKHQETRDRACDADVEKSPLGVNRRANADERPRCSDWRRRRQKERQSHIDAVITRSQIMAHLVRKQDAHER